MTLVGLAEEPVMVRIGDAAEVLRLGLRQVLRINTVVCVAAAIQGSDMLNFTRKTASIGMHGFGQDSAPIPNLARVTGKIILAFVRRGQRIGVAEIGQLGKFISLASEIALRPRGATIEKFTESAEAIGFAPCPVEA